MLKLKELLQSKGLKQKWLADKMGVSEVTVSNWVSQKHLPNKEHMNKLSALLNTPINSIQN